MPADPRSVPVEALPTVILEHARTGQPIVVDLRDYLAGRDGRYADWRLLGQGGFVDPPKLRSEGGPPDPDPPDPDPPDPDPPEPDSPADADRTDPGAARRRRRKHRRSRQ